MSRDRPNGTDPNSPKLTWAIGANGKMAHISEAENGLECECICPTCRGALIARQGEVREHHFAHASEDIGEECRRAPETALHRAAKEVLAACKTIMLPAIKTSSGYADPDSHRGEYDPELEPPERRPIESVEVEQKLGSIIPDLILMIDGRKLLVEITVTHGVDEDKRKRIRGLGISCLEIDLSDIGHDLPRKELEEIVVDGIDHKHWLYNVDAAEKIRKRPVPVHPAAGEIGEETYVSDDSSATYSYRYVIDQVIELDRELARKGMVYHERKKRCQELIEKLSRTSR